jgi:Sin3 histone deacetylase corepressor complex component SDS3
MLGEATPLHAASIWLLCPCIALTLSLSLSLTDTEDASEPEMFKMEEGDTAMDRGSYKEKIGALKEQLNQIREGTDPEYLKKLNELVDLRDKRLFIAETFRDYELSMAKEEYEREKSQAITECETKRAELKDNLLLDLHEKKKAFENLRSTMEITTGAYLFEPKMIVTRKLRRRNYETLPVPEKRRRTSPFFSTLVYELDEAEIDDDIKLICKGKGGPPSSNVTNSNRSTLLAPAPSLTVGTPEMIYDVKVEDCKLHYEGKW